MKGGSKASNLVMETSNPKLCDDPTSVVTEGAPIEGDVKQLSLYQTTGGGRRKSKSNKKRNSKKSRSKKSKSKKQQKGGSRSKNRFPLRKRKKRYAKRCSACESCGRKMVGGSPASNLVMASNPSMCDGPTQPVTPGNPYSENMGKTQLYATTGGARQEYAEAHPGVNIRGNCGQSGGGSGCGLAGAHPGANQMTHCNQSGGGGCDLAGAHPGVNQMTHCNQTGGGGCDLAGAHPGANQMIHCNQSGGGSDWRSTVYSRGPVNQPSQDPAQFRMFTQSAEFIPNEALRAAKFTGGSRKRRSKKDKGKGKSKKINSIRSDRGQSGGGSDWVGTLYSRGPVNQPSQNPQQFRAFTNQGQYIPNESLRSAKFM